MANNFASEEDLRLLHYTWVKTVKDTGEVKARLCICGNLQKEEETFWETSSTAPRATTTRMFYAKGARDRLFVSARAPSSPAPQRVKPKNL